MAAASREALGNVVRRPWPVQFKIGLTIVVAIITIALLAVAYFTKRPKPPEVAAAAA